MLSTQRNYEGILEASHRDLLDHNTALKWGMSDVFGVGGTMDKVQAHDEETQGSGSGSGFSDLSALENEATDDFGRRLLQHHRDAQRMNNALRGNQQAFRKARPRARVADILEREERKLEARDAERVGSGGSNESDPPVTVPREWGRRARKRTGWMRKILEPSEGDENEKVEEAVTPDEGAIYPHKTVYTGDLDWRASTDGPLQPEEDTPPSMRRQRRLTPPSSLRHMNTTLKHVTDSDAAADFTAASFLASTPAATRLPRKIDELTRREIEHLERQGVTTRALDNMDGGNLRRTSSSKLRERAIADGMATSPPTSLLQRPLTVDGKPESPSRIPRRRGHHKENMPPVNGEVNGDRSLEGGSYADLKLQPPVKIKNLQRPRHERNDSMNLLRKLARVSSASPSPARGSKVEDKVMEEASQTREAVGARPSSAKSADSNLSTDAEPLTKDMKQGKWDFGALQREPPVAGTGAGEHVQPKSEEGAHDLDRTPTPQDPAHELTTPVVIGAWVDSTIHEKATEQLHVAEAAKGRVDVPTSSKASETTPRLPDEDLRRIKSLPANPKSALEAIIRETRSQQNDLHFGESTIQSLEDIANPNLDPTDPTITFDFAAANGQQEENLDDERPLTQEQKDRRQENLAMDALDKHLRDARTSIKDASRGLRRVENRIEAAQEGPALTTTVTVVGKPGEHGWVHCDVCGGGYRSAWYALYAELRSCFYTKDPSARFGVRFTRLSFYCLLWFIWFIAETILHEIYGLDREVYKHPQLYYWTNWDSPHFGIVIPTLILRPLWPIYGPVWTYLFGDLQAWWEEMTEEVRASSYGYPGPPSMRRSPGTVNKVLKSTLASTLASTDTWTTTAAATSTRIAQSLVDAVDEVGRMWDDELLS